MQYRDIINRNHAAGFDIPWWTRYAFHYTHVSNAANILISGQLLSRDSALELHVMDNDNASRQVIDVTQRHVTSRVRFYFRPLTPTQYYNEGYKHPALRYHGDEKANVPVPVFFLFDLESILASPDAVFSETSMAGSGSAALSGPDAFSRLNFGNIYDTGWERIKETRSFRHAEIMLPSPFDIRSCLRRILCRNQLERTTLLNMLRHKGSAAAFNAYKDIIVCPKREVFQNNGLFIKSCTCLDNILSLSFEDTSESRKYIRTMKERNNVENLEPVTVNLFLEWCQGSRLLQSLPLAFKVNAESPQIPPLRLPAFAMANVLRIRAYIDENLMCFIEHPLEGSDTPY